MYSVDKQQGPTVYHRELYSTSYDKPQWKRIQKRMGVCVCVCVCVCVIESLSRSAEIKTTYKSTIYTSVKKKKKE